MESSSILIVDDEELIRETLRLDLLDQGYAVDLAASGDEALGLLDKAYDLIITDLMMEGTDGLEVLRLAKDKRPDQAVFILTGHRELEAAVGALRLGADDYLTKPYDYDEMILRVSRCLADRKLRQTVRMYESLLSICSECKKIRDTEQDENGQTQWISIEQFLNKTTGSELSHGICPECYRKKMTELKDMIRRGTLFSSP
ncbi:response regulator receiver protein [Desulfobulbus propionicus DSM 2032]|jgi:DNA-binding response OmpR family regulator|uniref:Response regulator receiver protein n=1 Tax=Desulfobulbus propionicus (strain ATCC 33891 / DSM 2032 / VKM B-1956 / 1pr3) TaxID=577650 RepID=A0A7U4DQ09_DESPD|nr:response regulator [Desulfobulbus propionicus]ADW18701.1 response regulator receiver protein [Desulfobulbus propionicus DSM 2032]